MKAFPLIYYALHALLLVAMAILAFVAPARADEAAQCPPYEQVSAVLATRWGEMPIGGGFLNEGAILMLFADPAGDTWTLILRQADGGACSLASGTGWMVTPAPVPGREG